MLLTLSQSLSLVALFAATSPALAKPLIEERLFANASNKNLVFDARIKKGSMTPADFDNADKSPFLVDGAHGRNLTWAQIITLPDVKPTMFDPEGKESAIEISLSDAAVFQPAPDRPGEVTNRRADLYVNISTPTSTPIGSTDVTGLKTLHFSIQTNASRPLNYTHNYGLSWMQSSDYTKEQWWLRAGTLDNTTAPDIAPKSLIFVGDDEHDPKWSTPFTDGVWHNFGVVMDFDRNTTQLMYSNGTSPLTNATAPFPDDLSGGGGYHFGVYKRATNSNHSDGNFGMTTGYEESNIDESVIYASIFMEDTGKGDISMGPSEVTKFVL